MGRTLAFLESAVVFSLGGTRRRTLLRVRGLTDGTDRSLCTRTRKWLPQFRVLGLGLLQYGDVVAGVTPWAMRSVIL